MPIGSITADSDTLCPVCWESVHSDKPVGVTTGCGHIWHQACYRSWQRKGEYIYESSTASSTNNNRKKRYTLNSHLNCIVCQQPTGNFVDLFIRLPNGSGKSHKDRVTQLEQEFNTVSRRTQLSLEKEIARRDFEQTWLQEERQLSQAAWQRAEQRHEQAIGGLETNLKQLKVNYERKSKNMEDRRRSSSSSHSNSQQNNLGGGILQFQSNEEDESISFSTLEGFNLFYGASEEEEASFVNNTATLESRVEEGHQASVEDDLETHANDDIETSDFSESTATTNQVPSILGVATISNAPNAMQWQKPRSLLTWSDSTDSDDPPSSVSNDEDVARAPDVASLIHSWEETNASPNPNRPLRPKDTIFHPTEDESSQPTPQFPLDTSRSRRSILSDEIFAPVLEEDSKLPATLDNNNSQTNQQEEEDRKPPASRKRKGSLKTSKTEKSSREATTTTTARIPTGDGEYERQRLEAETAYYQHQAELVEIELEQTEIELEQDELALQQREQRIRMERSRLEESFTSIQRRVEESKQEARDKQKLTALEQKFIKYKIARCREEERFEQELEHLKQEEALIGERERCEKQRQETEKVRLKKELNQLIKVMNRLERAKELARLAEEQSSASQNHETCVVCFEPLDPGNSELGVVECGHTFHSDCWDRWEKSKRQRGSSSVPCPLCNIAINNVCVTLRFGSSLYTSSTASSSLAKHFQKEEGRWQRRRLSGFGLATGEASS